MEKEEQLFRKRIKELAELSYERDIPVSTDFLTLSEQTIFQNILSTLPPVRVHLSGGFLMSERKVACFLPSYEEEPSEYPFVCLKISPSSRKFAEELTHRDYLGAVMSLGMERQVLGDIVLKDGDAFLFILRKMSRYVEENLTSIRHTPVTVSLCEETGELLNPELEELKGTVSSPRLDAVLSLCGRLSRTKAAAYIEGEKVSVNGLVCTNASRLLKGGEVLSVRGLGKFRFEEAGAITKKGRVGVRIFKYQ